MQEEFNRTDGKKQLVKSIIQAISKRNTVQKSTHWQTGSIHLAPANTDPGLMGRNSLSRVYGEGCP
jgi:S-adenosylmethionine synthetase